MIITKLDRTKPELRFCAGLNPVHVMLEICNDKDLRQCSGLEIRLNTFRRSTIPKKQKTTKTQFINYESFNILRCVTVLTRISCLCHGCSPEIWNKNVTGIKTTLLCLKQFLAPKNSLKMIENAFYFTLKPLFVLKIFKFLSWLFGHAENLID